MNKNMFFSKDIFCEHYNGGGKLIVFFPGFPSMPTTPEFINNRINIIMPRYPGSWESNGKFSHKNNIKQMINLCKSLENKIIILSCSYGSLVASEVIKKIGKIVDVHIMVTPFLGCKFDLSKEKSKVEKYMKNVYRFEKSFDDFEREITNANVKISGKNYVILCSQDQEINECFYDVMNKSDADIKVDIVQAKHGYDANIKSMPLILRFLNEYQGDQKVD
ncbi:MAG: hypothetical protein N3D75_03730 [Candidatus Aenigmarchaeota archaeon]|nr:hypothetical protein [Candidatus Aenigmarchaeota archaeon]